VVLLCSSVLFASAARCHGGDVTIGGLRYSDVTAKLVSEVPLDLDEKTTTDPLGSPSQVQTLATMSGDPYPINHRLPTPFASVQYPSGGVGVSGIVFQKDATLSAQLLYEESVTNIEKVPVQIHFSYKILPLNVSLIAGDGIRGQSAKVAVIADVTHFAGSHFIDETRVYDYSLRVTKPRFDGGADAYDIERSADINRDAGHETLIDQNHATLFGVHYDEFNGERDLEILAPGDTLIVKLNFLATADAGGTPEVGMQALFGDPSDVTGDLTKFINITGAAVPEPSSLELVVIGALALLPVSLVVLHKKERRAASETAKVALQRRSRLTTRWSSLKGRE
jgi:hypothetical protein